MRRIASAPIVTRALCRATATMSPTRTRRPSVMVPVVLANTVPRVRDLERILSRRTSPRGRREANWRSFSNCHPAAFQIVIPALSRHPSFRRTCDCGVDPAQSRGDAGVVTEGTLAGLRRLLPRHLRGVDAGHGDGGFHHDLGGDG